MYVKLGSVGREGVSVNESVKWSERYSFSAMIEIFTSHLDVLSPPPLSFQPWRAQKSKSAKASCCSAVRMKGLGGGERTGWSRVNSLSKLLTSTDSLIDGRKGGFTLLVSRASQSISWRRVQKVNEVNADNWLSSIRGKSLLIQHNSIRFISRNQSLTIKKNTVLNSDRHLLVFFYIWKYLTSKYSWCVYLWTLWGKDFTSKNWSPFTSFASLSPAPSLFKGFFFNSCRHV